MLLLLLLLVLLLFVSFVEERNGLRKKQSLNVQICALIIHHHRKMERARGRNVMRKEERGKLVWGEGWCEERIGELWKECNLLVWCE